MAGPQHSAPGAAELEVASVQDASAVVVSSATSPLRLLVPRPRGDCVWGYLANLGGGLVAGDETSLDLRVGRAARCFIGSQSSTKVYRNPARRPCGHRTRAVVGRDGFLALVPAPVQPFAGSAYDQHQTFHLAAGAGLVLVDSFSSGRAACGERWAFDHFASRNEVFVADLPSAPGEPARRSSRRLFLDSVRLDPAGPPSRPSHAVGRMNCFAMLLLAGSLLQGPASDLLSMTARLPVRPRASLLVSASPVGQGACVRFAGERTDQVEAELYHHLQFAAGLLGGLPWERRW